MDYCSEIAVNNMVLLNPLIVVKVCSFSKAEDLPSLRRVNSLFYREATKFLKLQHNSIHLLSDRSLLKFLALMRSRLKGDEESGAFPFSNFIISLFNLDQENLERFALEVGSHVRRLYFLSNPNFQWAGMFKEWEYRPKVACLLSRTPEIVELNLTTDQPMHVCNKALLTFPASFPRLRALDVQHRSRRDFYTIHYGSENVTPLLALLTSRAPNLRYEPCVQFPDERMENNLDLSDLRLIPPFVGLGKVTVRHGTASIMHELKGLRFAKLDVKIDLNFEAGLEQPSSTEAQSLLQSVYDCLDEQSSDLRSLKLNFVVAQPGDTTFPLPPLAGLSELSLVASANELISSSTRLYVPLTPRQFPCMKSLDLQTFGHYLDIQFSEIPLYSVREFTFHCQDSLERNSWASILPNLICFHLKMWPQSPNNSQNLSYILRNFTRLQHLDVQNARRLDAWDVLTGAAPRPISSAALLQPQVFDGRAHGIHVEPLDGVYQVSSLANLQSLETLKFFMLSSRSTLNAVLYMTCAGLLKPLKVLTIHFENTLADIKVGKKDKEVYTKLLARVHDEAWLGT